MAKLQTERDHTLPGTLEIIERRLGALAAYSAQGAEQARQSQELVFSFENARKAFTGELKGLRDPEVWEKKAREEREFRAKVDANADWKREYATAWDEIEAAEQKARDRAADRYKGSFGSPLTSLVHMLVQLVEEKVKPDAQRLEEFRDAQLPALEFQLFSTAPVHPGVEETLLRASLELALEKLGPDDSYIKAALEGRTPAEVAKAAIQGTALGEAAVRKALVAGGPDAVRTSADSARGAGPPGRSVHSRDAEAVRARDRERRDARGRAHRPGAIRGLRQVGLP